MDNLFSKVFYSANQEGIETFFYHIANETVDKKYGYLDMIKQNLLAVFITLMRSITELKYYIRLNIT